MSRSEREWNAVSSLLDRLATIYDENIGRDQISQLEHSYACAEQAKLAGAPDWLVVTALLHDIGKPLSEIYHPEIGSAIVREYLGEHAAQIILHHGEYQDAIMHHTNYTAQYSSEEWAEDAARLAAWDANAFTKSTLDRAAREGLWKLARSFWEAK